MFFTGCNLRCVFCQNADISRGGGGQSVTVQELREILLRLRDLGVDSIDTEAQLLEFETILEERGRIPYSPEQRPSFPGEDFADEEF